MLKRRLCIQPPRAIAVLVTSKYLSLVRHKSQATLICLPCGVYFTPVTLGGIVLLKFIATTDYAFEMYFPKFLECFKNMMWTFHNMLCWFNFDRNYVCFYFQVYPLTYFSTHTIEISHHKYGNKFINWK